MTMLEIATEMETRSVTVRFRVTTDELKLLHSMAEREERTISDLLRRWMREHASQAGLSIASPVDFRHRTAGEVDLS